MRRIIGLFLLFFQASTTDAQDTIVSKTYPKNDFRNPLDLTPSLAGSFGEIRANHFHSGLDLRTNQREGYPVYAAGNGYVARIRVQTGGFGNAVYVAHPNGYTTVYAHLSRFSESIARALKAYRYNKQTSDADFPLMTIEIPVKKGEIIAWSGNTGSSGGPHLHFEIRDTQTEETINPQLFGITVRDITKPTIKGLYVYRLGEEAFSEKTQKKSYALIGAAGKYQVRNNEVIKLYGESGFGISTFDQQVSGGNKNGVYSIELKMDEKVIYRSVLEGFYFEDSRAVNAHIDYTALLTSGLTIQKSFVEPGDPLTIYKELNNRGVINLSDEDLHTFTYRVKDVAGNTSELVFRAQASGSTQTSPSLEKLQKFSFDKENNFKTEDLKLQILPGVLYSDIDFKYTKGPRPARAYSNIHTIHTPLIPVHKPYILAIKPAADFPQGFRDKVVIADTRGRQYGGVFEEGFIKANIKTFGSFYVTVDTLSPRIIPVNALEGSRFTAGKKITFKISDNLSGIKDFIGTIDGRWVLMEFDSKTRTLWHTLDEGTPTGNHDFRLVLSDMKLNTITYTFNFNL